MDLYASGILLVLLDKNPALTPVVSFYAAFKSTKGLFAALNSIHLAPIYLHPALQMENSVFGM